MSEVASGPLRFDEFEWMRRTLVEQLISEPEVADLMRAFAPDFARRTSPARIMWLGTYRLIADRRGSHPLKELRQELRLHRLCEEVVLDPFSEVEVAEYLQPAGCA